MDKVKEIPQTVKIIRADLPDGVHGAITPVNGDRYLIVLNSNDSLQEQRQGLLHELLHYYNGDLDGTGNINEIEHRTHLQEGRLTNGKD